jgi:hypothetical protein
MSLAFLKSISGAWDFEWFELPANNTAGGVLVGFRNDLFDILSVHKFKFFISVTVRNKSDGFSWCFVAVYGTTYYDQKMEFIAKLHDVLSGCSVPTLVGGGDFNLVRSDADKRNDQVNANWTLLFNDWINRWSLIDLKIANTSFTWSNHQSDLIMATLDLFWFLLVGILNIL